MRIQSRAVSARQDRVVAGLPSHRQVDMKCFDAADLGALSMVGFHLRPASAAGAVD